MAWWTGSGRASGGGSSSGRRRFTRAAQAARGPAKAAWPAGPERAAAAGGEGGAGARMDFTGGPARSGLAERVDGRVLVVVHVEDGDELGDGQDVSHLGGKAEQPELHPPVGGGRVGAHQLADA